MFAIAPKNFKVTKLAFKTESYTIVTPNIVWLFVVDQLRLIFSKFSYEVAHFTKPKFSTLLLPRIIIKKKKKDVFAWSSLSLEFNCPNVPRRKDFKLYKFVHLCFSKISIFPNDCAKKKKMKRISRSMNVQLLSLFTTRPLHFLLTPSRRNVSDRNQ